MLKYVIRRVLYMIPTVIGVIIVTFVLFNIAGGDPGRMKFGKQASAKRLEEFDLKRGYNKPLFFGMWGTTRAYGETDFNVNAEVWSAIEGVSFDTAKRGKITLAGGKDFKVPLAMPLAPSEKYRWVFRCRSTGKGAFSMVAGDTVARTIQLTADNKWRKIVFEFQTPDDASKLGFKFSVETGSAELDYMRLNRRVRHFLDSQFVFFLGQIAHYDWNRNKIVMFDFGESVETNEKVTSMILSGILPSLSLTVPMFIIGLIVSISLALLCAFYRDTILDRFFVVTSVVLMSVNYLVWIVLGQFLLGHTLRLFPVWGYESWQYLVLPCLIGVVSGLGANLRFYRTVMLDEMYKDYVRTAFAKGVGKTGVLFKHVLKNAMIPILTSVVMAIPFLYAGSLLLETFFGIPGLGRMSINAINSADFDVLKVIVFVEAILYVIANLITDLCYAAVDPRVKLK